MTDSVILKFHKIDQRQNFDIAVLSLNRPQKHNAFDEEMIERLEQAFDLIAAKTTCRLLVLQAIGASFSAGADLKWMKKAATLSFDDNVVDAEKLARVFSKLYQLTIPTLAVVQGSAYGGAVGLIACCDIVLALEHVKFSLREVRIGLLPAMILPYLFAKLEPTALQRLGISGEEFDAAEAKRIGLVSELCSATTLSSKVQELINQVLSGAPEAQQRYKRLLRFLTWKNFNWQDMQQDLCQIIAKARVGDEAQKGLAAFFAGEKPYWVQELTEKWTM